MKSYYFSLHKGFKSCLLFTFLCLPILAWTQTRTIQGHVSLSNDNSDAIGVSVQVKGATLGTLTDATGNYKIAVTGSESVLVFSYVGFLTKEVTIGANSVLDIVLEENNEALREVVVTALGIKKEKAKLGYATQEISSEKLKKAPEPNLATSLTGRIAGLQINTKSTLFEDPQILLRGKATLVVIDGVPTKTDFWNLNSDDIESVNVLKGTAAAALYGSQGINGAIMITTKKGKSDGKNGIEISLNSTTQFHAGYIRIPETQDQYGMGWNGQYAFVDGKGGGTFDDYGYVYGPKLNQPDPTTASGFVEIPQYNSPIDPITGKRVPLPFITRSKANLRKFLRHEMLTTNNVSVAGKTDRGDYRISVSHLYQRGQVPNTELNSTTASLAGSLQLSKRVRTEATISYNRQYSPNYPSAGYGADNYFYNILLWMGPDVDLNDMRDYWQPGKENIQQNTFNYTWYNNPWYLANEYIKSYTNDVIVGQTNMTCDLTDDLKFMIRSGVTTNNVFSDRKTPYSFIYYSNGASPQGNYSLQQKNAFQIISDALLTYNRNFTEDFELTVSAGASHRFSSLRELNSRTVGLNIPGYFNLTNSIAPAQAKNYLEEKEVGSAYGYADIGYKHAIYLGVTARNDWTSALQKPYNSFFYPSVTGAVVVSELLKFPKWVTYMKFRSSWANISTDADPYKTVAIYNTGTTYNSTIRWDGNLPLNRPGSLIAPSIQPNQTISQEYGAEMKFFHNRLGMDLSYFTYNDRNSIINAPISQASGFDDLLVNGGEINRKGVELELIGTPIKTSRLRWDVTANFGQTRSYRRAYYGNTTIVDGVKVGERIDVYNGWAWQRTPDGKIVTAQGRPQYIDHAINVGHTDPDLTYGFGSNVSYKGFSFSFLVDGRVGGKMYNGVEAKLYEGGMHPASANHFRDESYAGEATFLLEGLEITEGTAVWDIQGKLISDTRKFAPNTTKVKYIDHLFDTYVNGIDEAVLYDRDFAKLREVTLTYSVPQRFLSKKIFKEANFSVIGRNLWLWSKVPFMDPDGYTGSNLAEPTYRNVGVNVNLKF
jgi:TonB-linked SusC/RagA family outer membrane protein